MAVKYGSLEVFRYRNYRIWFTSIFISNIGTWSQRVAQDWLVVVDLHKGGSELGVVTAIQFLPSLLLSAYGGILADRFNKRKILMITNFGGAVTALILGVLVINHQVNLFLVYVLALILGTFSAIDGPSGQSFNSELVDKKNLPKAVGFNVTNFHSARIIGPAITGFIIKAFGTGPAFFVNAISFLFVVAGLALMNSDEILRIKAPEEKPKLAEAWHYIRSRPDISLVILNVFFTATFGLNFQISNTLFATRIFHKDAGQYGVLGSYIAAGAVVAALLVVRRGKRKPVEIIWYAAGFGILEMFLSQTPTYLAYSLVLVLCGFGAISTMLSSNTYVQLSTRADLRGRVMGIYFLVFLGGAPFGSPIIGWASDYFGVRETLFVCGLITTLGGLSSYRLFKKRLVAFEEDNRSNAN
jgi:MFS family permease